MELMNSVHSSLELQSQMTVELCADERVWKHEAFRSLAQRLFDECRAKVDSTEQSQSFVEVCLLREDALELLFVFRARVLVSSV